MILWDIIFFYKLYEIAFNPLAPSDAVRKQKNIF